MRDTADRALQDLLTSPTRFTPRDIAERMVALYRIIAGLPDKVQWVQRQLQRLIASDDASAIALATHAIAIAIDAEPALYDRNPYHSRQHYCEVMLAVGVLCRTHDIPACDAQLVLLAALVHDLGHDGQPSREFRLERQSVDHALAHLERAGVAPDTCLRLAALVLATQPFDGLRYVLDARSFHGGKAERPSPPRGAPEVVALVDDERLARLAGLLCEADILPSVGLTFEHAMQLQDLLSYEWGRPLSPVDKLIFLEGVLACGILGSFFLPNALAIRGALLDRAPVGS